MSDGRKGIHVFCKYGLLGKRWYWHGRAGNSQITTSSEGYNSRDAAYKGLCATAEIFGADPWELTIYEAGVRRNPYGGIVGITRKKS